MHDIQTAPPEGIKVFLNEADVTDIQAVLEGPGKFSINLICRLLQMRITFIS